MVIMKNMVKRIFKGVSIPLISMVLLIVSINDRIHRYVTPSKYITASELNDSSKLSRWGIDYSRFNYKDDNLTIYLSDTIGIQSSDNSLVKTEKIYKHIIDKTIGRGGVPDQILDNKSPIEQLDLVNKGLSKIWCGNYGFIFPYFLQKQGIVSRYISIGPVEGNEIGEHILTEVYIPELKKWILVDPTFNYLSFKNKEGLLLNLEEIKKQELDSGNFTQWINDSLVDKNRTDISTDWMELVKNEMPARYFSKDQLSKQFDSPTKFQRLIKYFLPTPNYFINKKPDRIIDNYTIWLISDILLIAGLVFFGYKLIRSFTDSN